MDEHTELLISMLHSAYCGMVTRDKKYM